MDFIGPLPIFHGYTGFFVAVDKFSKLTRLIPCSFGRGGTGVSLPLLLLLCFLTISSAISAFQSWSCMTTMRVSHHIFGAHFGL